MQDWIVVNSIDDIPKEGVILVTLLNKITMDRQVYRAKIFGMGESKDIYVNFGDTIFKNRVDTSSHTITAYIPYPEPYVE